MNQHDRHRPRRLFARRAAVATAVASLIVAGTGFATAVPTSDDGRGGDRSSAVAQDVSVRGGLEVIELQPYEPLDIAEDVQLGLLPEGKQNYVLASPDDFEESVEEAKSQVGDDIRPDSTSLMVRSSDGDIQLIAGAWRLDEAPSEIVIYIDGGIGYVAQLVHLPGKPGWGTFHLDTSSIEGMKETFVLVAKDSNGNIFDTHAYGPWPSGGSTAGTSEGGGSAEAAGPAETAP